jgi:hypothetical protein
MDSYMAESLAVVALCEVGLCFVSFDLYNDVVEGSKGEVSL